MPLLNNLFFEIQNGIIVASIKDLTYIYNISITSDYKNVIISWDPIIITGFVTNYVINCIQGNLGSKSTTSNSIIFPDAISETTYLFTITPSIDGINGSTTYTKTFTTPLFITATGGSITTENVNGIPYRFHKFTTTTSSTFTVINETNAYILVVGGGGSGGSINNTSESGGGGGGGEVFYTGNSSNAGTVLLKKGTTCTITVGATSTVGSGSSENYNGNPSSCVVTDKNSNILINIIAKGGCYGGGSYVATSAVVGAPGTGSGSGGGGCGINNNVNGSNGTTTSYTSVDSTFKDKYYNLANNGASGIHAGIPYTNNTQGGAGGGGGGAGGGGSSCTFSSAGYNNIGGNGGSSYLWIDSNYYGGGGSGGASMVINGANFVGSPGIPGTNAGKGGDYGNNGNPGLSNFGGGGGGCSSRIALGSGGAGGSGVVIIAYPV